MARTGRNAAWMILPVILISYSIAEGFTGNEWRTFSESGQIYYVAGVVDTWADIVDTDKARGENTALSATFKILVDCPRKMPYSQLVAIAKKYLDEHPENWGMDMPAIVWSAMWFKGCQP
jgi:hypothetical protein